MSDRPNIPIRTQRILWAESMGHCMNPACHLNLFVDESYPAELAHIVAHADGGDISPDNLLVLCRNCHKSIHDLSNDQTTNVLSNWKTDRSNEIRRRFSQTYDSFAELSTVVIPLLQRNLQIFESYGPSSESSIRDDRHGLWVRFEGELIANNRKMEAILEKNHQLLHHENRDAVAAFSAHVREFVQTRDEHLNPRVNLFPGDLNSIFGVAPAASGEIAPSVSALQNLITQLVRGNRFVQLELVNDQVLTFLGKKGKVELSLTNRPRIQQIYWTRKLYRPHTTDVRLDGLVFFLRWLHGRGIEYSFPREDRLVELVIGNHNVLLCYKYCLSVADLLDIVRTDTEIVVNLHNWNDGPVSAGAGHRASEMNIRLFNQNDFFVFAHRNLK